MHTIGVEGFVTDAQGRFLMLLNPKGYWDFPGGQVEPGEDLIQALQREVFEETRVEVAVQRLVGVYTNVRHNLVLLYFLCDWIQGQPCPTAESLEVAWLQREDMVSRITLPVLRDRVKDLLAFQGSPIYRAYAFDPSDPGSGYMVHAERGI